MNSNQETVHLIYEAFGKGDILSKPDHLAENVQWEQWADNSLQKAGVAWMLAGTGKDGALEGFQVLSVMGKKNFEINC